MEHCGTPHFNCSKFVDFYLLKLSLTFTLNPLMPRYLPSVCVTSSLQSIPPFMLTLTSFSLKAPQS